MSSALSLAGSASAIAERKPDRGTRRGPLDDPRGRGVRPQLVVDGTEGRVDVPDPRSVLAGQ